MNTSVNNNNIESNNRVINYDIEIVRDFDGTYYVNARNELHEHIKGLPEYLPYKELKKTVKEALGVMLPPLKSLTFEGHGRKHYANAYGLQGIEIHQEPLAFGLQDKVILGSFGESRPYAIGCTVTGYRWDSKAGEFLYILQGEDGKEYADFARNIIPDKDNDPKGEEKAMLEPASEITEAEGVKIGDKVKHVWSDEVATVTAIRKAYWDASAGEVWLFTLDYGKDTKGDWKTVLGPFKMDLNGKEFRREAFTLYEPSEITEQREQNDACISSAESRRDKANGQIKAADIARKRQESPGTVNTSWATDFTPEDFEKLTSRYEIADEDSDIMGRRFHTGEGLWTVDVFVSDYAGNEAHALIYLLTGEGEVRANVLSLDHLRQTLTEAKGWTRTA